MSLDSPLSYGSICSIPWASTVSDTYHADASAFVFSVSPESKRFRRIGNDDKAVRFRSRFNNSWSK